VRAQLVLAEALLKMRAIQEAIDVLKVAIKAAETSGWPALMVELYDRMGSAYYQLRHPHEAGSWWDKALSAYDQADLADPLLKARILGHRANLHYVAGQPREAISGYKAAIDAAEDVLDMPALGGIYEGLAVSFQKAGDLTHALEYAQRSLRLFDTLRDVRMSAQLRNNMAEILLSQGRNEEAEVLFLAGAEQLRHVGDQDLLPHLVAGAAEAGPPLSERSSLPRRPIVQPIRAASPSTMPRSSRPRETRRKRSSATARRTRQGRRPARSSGLIGLGLLDRRALQVAPSIAEPNAKSFSGQPFGGCF